MLVYAGQRVPAVHIQALFEDLPSYKEAVAYPATIMGSIVDDISPDDSVSAVGSAASIGSQELSGTSSSVGSTLISSARTSDSPMAWRVSDALKMRLSKLQKRETVS